MFQYERKMLDGFLHTLDYPLARNSLIEQAERVNLPVQFLGMFQRLENREYRSADDVEGTLSEHKA